MVSDRVSYEGDQAMQRTHGRRRRPIHQRMRYEITSQGLTVSIVGKESGTHRGIESNDPGAIAFMRSLDRAQLAASYAELPPAPEPTRVPVNQIPDDARLCWVCDGTGYAEDDEGLCECRNCRGEGWLPNAEIIND